MMCCDDIDRTRSQSALVYFTFHDGCISGLLRVLATLQPPVLRALSLWETRMWANAQRDGRPAEYRWRPLFNAAVWLTPATRVPCSNAAKTRNLLKFAGVPQTPELISAVKRAKGHHILRTCGGGIAV